MKNLIYFGVLVVLASVAWAQAVPPPVETDFETDICAICRMAVTGGKPLFFDDIGCLVKYECQGQIPAADVMARKGATILAWTTVPMQVS